MFQNKTKLIFLKKISILTKIIRDMSLFIPIIMILALVIDISQFIKEDFIYITFVISLTTGIIFIYLHKYFNNKRIIYLEKVENDLWEKRNQSKEYQSERVFSKEERTKTKENYHKEYEDIFKKNRYLEKELKILNLEESFENLSKKDIKIAYRRESKKYHPDLSINEKDKSKRNTKMIEINLAYEKIINLK